MTASPWRRYACIGTGPTSNLLADDETALSGLRSIQAHLTDAAAATRCCG